MNDLVDSLNKLEVGDENENDEEDGDESENEEEESETTFVLHPRSKITLFRALLGGCGFGTDLQMTTVTDAKNMRCHLREPTH